jgi:hypothetical protein
MQRASLVSTVSTAATDVSTLVAGCGGRGKTSVGGDMMEPEQQRVMYFMEVFLNFQNFL